MLSLYKTADNFLSFCKSCCIVQRLKNRADQGIHTSYQRVIVHASLLQNKELGEKLYIKVLKY